MKDKAYYCYNFDQEKFKSSKPLTPHYRYFSTRSLYEHFLCIEEYLNKPYTNG